MVRLRSALLGIGAAACLVACGDAGRDAPARVAGTPGPSPERAAPGAEAREPTQAERDWRAALPAVTEADVPARLAEADAALAAGHLEAHAGGPGALELYAAVLLVAPDAARAQAGQRASLDALLERGALALRAGDLEEGGRIAALVASAEATHRDLPAYRARIVAARAAQAEVRRADAAGKAARWAGEDSVAAHLEAAFGHVPGFSPAQDLREAWAGDRLRAAWAAARDGDYPAAAARLAEARAVHPRGPATRVMDLRIAERRDARSRQLLDEGRRAVAQLRLERAERALRDLSRIAAQPGGVAELRGRIHLARHYGPFRPRAVFSERLAIGGVGPEMVVVPYGAFTMGAGESDAAAQAVERPAHAVRFARGFAIGRNEVTVGEFGRFIAATGYRTQATRAGRSRVYDEKGGVLSDHEGVDWRRDHVGREAPPSLPVVHVSHEDARAYAHWLSRQTHALYRLPSEAEFEYVLRAGRAATYPWGEGAPSRPVGNLAGDGDLSRSSRRWGNAIPGYRDAFWGPSPVRNFEAEPFGTFDLVGNVSEWTLDCWHEGYQRAPADGSAWVNPGCTQRVVRGSSWGSSLEQSRAAHRLPMDAATSTARLGFRVVREL